MRRSRSLACRDDRVSLVLCARHGDSFTQTPHAPRRLFDGARPTGATGPIWPTGRSYARADQGHHHPRRAQHLSARGGRHGRSRARRAPWLRCGVRQPQPRQRRRASGGSRRDRANRRRGAGRAASVHRRGGRLAVLGEPPDEVVLAPPRTVLKTSSGKIRRVACRELFEARRIGAREHGAARSPSAWACRCSGRTQRPTRSAPLCRCVIQLARLSWAHCGEPDAGIG